MTGGGIGNLARRPLATLRRMVDDHYRAHHPGPLARAAIRALAPVVRRVAANDKWTLSVHAPLWMQAARQAPRLPLPPSKRILIVCAYRGQFSLDLSLAALLAWRGHRITFAYAPRLQSPIKEPVEDHASAGPYLRAALRQVEAITGGRVRVLDLSSLDATEDFRVAMPDEAMVEMQARADTVMKLRLESPDESDPDQARTIAFYRAKGLVAHRRAFALLNAKHSEFDLAILGNGMSFDLAHFAHMARRFGLPYVTLDKFAFRHVRLVNHDNALFAFDDLGLVWRRRAELGLEEEPARSRACAKAMALLNERREASQRNWAWKYQSVPGQNAQDAFHAAGVDPDEPYVLICTNVPFDAGFYNFTTMFPSMRDWLLETVAFLLRNTAINVVVRVHPGEKIHGGTAETSHANLKAAGLAPHPRLTVIDAEAPVNSYPVMERCRAGIVFSSTTGIEMAMLGRRVVVGADVYFAGRGFTSDASDRQGYFDALARAVIADPSGEDSAGWAKLAQLFHYCTHFLLQYPYCYDNALDLAECPPHRLVQGPEVEQYLRFLDTVAMTGADFDTKLEALHHTKVVQP